jgi:hypothetical protein
MHGYSGFEEPVALVNYMNPDFLKTAEEIPCD